MKRKFTEAKKANRSSGFHQVLQNSGHSEIRAYIRGHNKKPKGFGRQMLRAQAIFEKTYVTRHLVKTIYHYAY